MLQILAHNKLLIKKYIMLYRVQIPRLWANYPSLHAYKRFNEQRIISHTLRSRSAVQRQ